MNDLFAPAAFAAMIIPSISLCGLRCISRRSLKVPGSDSSALQQRYLSIAPFGMKLAFLPIAKPAPPRPRSPEASSSVRRSSSAISTNLLRSRPSRLLRIVPEPSPRQRLLAALQRLDDLLRVTGLQRADVAAVHGRH